MKISALALIANFLSPVSSALAFGQNDNEVEYVGKTPVSLSYVGTDGAQVAACATTGWFFGGFCTSSIHGPSDPSYTVAKTKGLDTDSELDVTTWGEGKISVSYALDSQKGCQGFQKTYVGFMGVNGLYNLYEVTNNQNEIDPTTAPIVATLSAHKSHARLDFVTNITQQSTQKKGNQCTWGISENTSIDLKAQH